MDVRSFSTILLGVEDKIEIPEKLKDFLSLDDQGMDGLEFMLSNPKLERKIPAQVRAEYEVLYGEISLLLDKQIKSLRKSLDDLEKNPKLMIHQIMENAYNNPKA